MRNIVEDLFHDGVVPTAETIEIVTKDAVYLGESRIVTT